MAQKLAHDLSKERTEDVRIREEIDFPGMLLPEKILNGLSANGFLKPSPIQLKALPLGRCGFDLILQAKSGTGKTCVFTIIALEMIEVERSNVQALIVAPTREIAIQITEVIRLIGSGIQGLKVHSFIGGTPFGEDRNKLESCHIAVGAPGRLKHLIKKNVLKTEKIRLFVLDEADKLMESSFLKDIKFMLKELPTNKQVIVASATMPPDLNKILTEHMKSPVRVCPHEGEAPILIGVRQLVIQVPSHPTTLQQLNLKVYGLVKLLTCVPFRQCIVFSNFLTRAESICHELERRGWPCKHTAGVLDQNERMEAFSALLQSRVRILLSTDLTSRGVDAPLVDMVVNLDLPNNGATYLHRIGRAGRYGSHGLAVTLAAEGSEMSNFNQMLQSAGATATIITPDEFPENLWDCDLEQFERIGANPTTLKILESDVFKSVKNCPANGITSEKHSEEAKTPKNENVMLNFLCEDLISTEKKSEFKNDADSKNEPDLKKKIKPLVVTDIQESISKLTDVMHHAENKIDHIESVDEMSKSLLEFSGKMVTPSKNSDLIMTTDQKHFETVLKFVNERNSLAFNKALERLKNEDVISVMKMLSLGEKWSPEIATESTFPQENGSSPKLGVGENEISDMKCESDISCTNLNDYNRKEGESDILRHIETQDISESSKVDLTSSLKDNIHKASKVSNVLDWGKCDISLAKNKKVNLQERVVENNSKSDHREGNSQFRRKLSSSSSCSTSSYDSEEDIYPQNNAENINHHPRHRYTIKSNNSSREFNAWYEQLKIRSAQIQYTEYWNYMLRR